MSLETLLWIGLVTKAATGVLAGVLLVMVVRRERKP